ncbi:hypothetical protein WJX72_003331 [[Myrmecia] bisecta]|uniref:cellulase n=1 Tax=[Myrmecia] bisecta TaxID=41462 RepID=A0AAW1P4I5_9CHLO
MAPGMEPVGRAAAPTQQFNMTAAPAPTNTDHVVQIKAARPKGDKPAVVEAPKSPWSKETEWNPWGLCVFFGYIAVYIFYYVVRAMFTLNTGTLWYSVLVLVLEWVTSVSMIIYVLAVYARRRKPLSPEVMALAPPPMTYNIRVFIPCYTESADIVKQTTLAAANALLPDKCRRTVYLLDDGKDPEKRDWVAKQGRDDIVYVSGRVRQKGECNGKACNLNNTLLSVYPAGKEVDPNELCCVFDADMICIPEFFMKILPELNDPKVGLVLSPQKFHNYDPNCDIFNHSNLIYWENILPGMDAWDNASCTGTNFVMRAKAGSDANWFPTWTLGEDMALALEIQKAGWKGSYVKEYLAVGEVPENVRNAYMQKSRWCKGGVQITFSKYNAVFCHNMSFLQKVLWNTAGCSYITNFITPIFIVVPVIGVLFGYFPLEFNLIFAIAFTLMMIYTQACLYGPNPKLWTACFFSGVASALFWFAYAKAIVNTLWGLLGVRKIRFKTTEKSVLAKTVEDSANKSKRRAAKNVLSGLWVYVQDTWIHIIIFVISLLAVILGIIRLVEAHQPNDLRTLSLMVSICWCFHNMIPSYLLLHFWCWKNAGLRIITQIFKWISLAIIIAVMLLIFLVLPNSYDYKALVGKSFLFYDAQKSGVLPANNPIPWRGTSGMNDAGPNGESLVGGFYNDGGYVKYGLPLASTTALLAWGMLAFPKGYTGSSLTDARNNIRWATDYMLKCKIGDNQYVGQVGLYSSLQTYYGRPEQMTGSRPVFVLDQDHPGSDLLGSTAAALAAASMVFEGVDTAYHNQLLTAAEDLYSFATAYKGKYSDSIPDAAYQYPSSGYVDDLAWAAIWLHKASKLPSYLDDAIAYYDQYEKLSAVNTTNTPLIFNWDNTMPGVYALLAQEFNWKNRDYRNRVETFLDAWMYANSGVVYTPAKFSYHGSDAPLRNAANAAMIAMLYRKDTNPSSKTFQCWSEYTARYILGDITRSFMVGFGKDYPTKPMSQAASCPGLPASNAVCTQGSALYSSAPNPHVLEGAIVAGPPKPDDQFTNSRTDPSNRVALDYNAGFTSLLASLGDTGNVATYTHCSQGNGFVQSRTKTSPF